MPYCTHFIAASGNSVAEWEKDINSKCKNLVQILWQSKGNLPLVPYCTNLFEKRLSLSPPLNSKQEQEPIHFTANVSLFEKQEWCVSGNRTACSWKVHSFSSAVYHICNSTFCNKLFQELTNKVDINNPKDNKMIYWNVSHCVCGTYKSKPFTIHWTQLPFCIKVLLHLYCSLPYCKILYWWPDDGR